MLPNRIVYSDNVEGSAAPTPAASPEPSGYSDEIKAIMDFDPFAAESEGPGSSSESVSGAPEGPVTQPAAVEPQEATPAPPAAPSPQDGLAEAARALQQTAAELPAAVAAAVQPKAQESEVDPWAPLDQNGQPVDYGRLNIPDAVIMAMASDNPAERKAATAHMIGSVAHLVQRMAVAQAVQQVRNEIATAMPRFVTERLVQHQQQQEVFQDFYGHFPQLSHPAIRPVVMAEAQKLAQQGGPKQWTPEFRDQLGRHVTALLRASVPVPAAPPAAAPGTMSGLNARPSGVGTPPAAQPWDDLFGPSS